MHPYILVVFQALRMTTPSEIFAEVLSEHAAHEAFDSEMSPNPYDPWRTAEKLATPDAVPFLIGVLERGGKDEVYYAAHALETLGAGGRAASGALEKRGEKLALFAVDEPRARELGLHRSTELARYDVSIREEIAKYVTNTRDPARIAAHFAELLEDADEAVVLFGLDVGGFRDRSGLYDVACRSAESVPLPSLRECLVRPSRRVRMAVARILEALHLPEDAQAVLSLHATDASPCHAGAWLGALPDSDRLLATAPIREVFEIVRRRRCAGLPTDAGAIRARLRDELDVRSDWRDIGDAARTVAELGDAELLDAVVDAVGTTHGHGHFTSVRDALRAFGNLGLEAARRGKARLTGARGQQLGWMIDELATPVVSHFLDLREADARFVDGNLEDGTLVDHGAYGAYAATLLREPTSKHAAFQCAWIDRGFGTPITHDRIEWLRSLGVAEDLLTELAVRPPAIVPNFRFAHRRVNPNAGIALIAERAGLFGVAANYAAHELDRLRERARAHIARLG